MKCPKCQFENIDGMNFCGKCGGRLEQVCPQCDFSNPAEYDCCSKYGINIRGLSVTLLARNV